MLLSIIIFFVSNWTNRSIIITIKVYFCICCKSIFTKTGIHIRFICVSIIRSRIIFINSICLIIRTKGRISWIISKIIIASTSKIITSAPKINFSLTSIAIIIGKIIFISGCQNLITRIAIIIIMRIRLLIAQRSIFRSITIKMNNGIWLILSSTMIIIITMINLMNLLFISPISFSDLIHFFRG